MALQDILKSIQTDTQEEIEKIEQETSEKKRALALEWDEKINAKRKAILATTQKKADDKIQQAKFMITSQKNAEILRKKQEVIEQVYNEAVKTLGRMTPKMYSDVMTKLIDNLPNVKGEIHSVADKDKKKLLEKTVKGNKHTLSKDDVQGSGGFVFKSGEIDIDNTFEALVNNVKESAMAEVADALFK